MHQREVPRDATSCTFISLVFIFVISCKCQQVVLWIPFHTIHSCSAWYLIHWPPSFHLWLNHPHKITDSIKTHPGTHLCLCCYFERGKTYNVYEKIFTGRSNVLAIIVEADCPHWPPTATHISSKDDSIKNCCSIVPSPTCNNLYPGLLGSVRRKL